MSLNLVYNALYTPFPTALNLDDPCVGNRGMFAAELAVLKTEFVAKAYPKGAWRGHQSY